MRLAGCRGQRHPACRQNRNSARRWKVSSAGRDITLHGSREPDRYGRVVAFVRVQGQDAPVQARLIDDGHLLVTAAIDDQDCARIPAQPRGTGAAGQTRHLGGTRCLKKHGNGGRYFGRGWAIRRGGRQGAVRPGSRGNALHQFRPALDAGLRGDYFKAEHCSLRGCGSSAEVSRTPADSRPGLGGAPGRAANSCLLGGADRNGGQLEHGTIPNGGYRFSDRIMPE